MQNDGVLCGVCGAAQAVVNAQAASSVGCRETLPVT